LSWKRKILAVVFPPFAVVDKGCGIYLSAFILTCLGWIPGVIYAFAYFKWEQRKQGDNSHQVSKLQNNRSASKSNNASYGTSQQSSPFDRPRRMYNNNQSGGWQGW
jgi:uncharacterized membrane protein YqaE (UPF0057 family)